MLPVRLRRRLRAPGPFSAVGLDAADIVMMLNYAELAETRTRVLKLLARKRIRRKLCNMADVEDTPETAVLVNVPHYRSLGTAYLGAGSTHYKPHECAILAWLALTAHTATLTHGYRVVRTTQRPRGDQVLARLTWVELPGTLTASQLDVLDALLLDGTPKRDAFAIASNPSWL